MRISAGISEVLTISNIVTGLLAGTMVVSDYAGNHVNSGDVVALILDSDVCTFDSDEIDDALVVELDDELFRVGKDLPQLQREATIAVERFWDC